MTLTIAFRMAVGLVLAATCTSSAAFAQSRSATLRVQVLDPIGAVIVGAPVEVQSAEGTSEPIRMTTNERGEAVFEALPLGRYTIRAESPGFEPKLFENFGLRRDARREMKLSLAKLTEEVTIGQDPRERATDPRGNAFGNLLTRAQIDALPDDPDEMEDALKQMAGSDAVIRVDGFRGGKLPPKSQIRGIRFRRDLFAAENHGGGMIFVDVMTMPGGGPFRGTADFTFRDESLSARNPMASRRGPEQQQSVSFSASGTIWKNKTGFSLTSNGSTGYDSRTIVAALPDTRLSDVVRRPSDRAAFSVRVDHALTAAHALRASYHRNDAHNENLGVGDFDLPERAYSRSTNEDVFRVSVNGPVGRNYFNETRLQLRATSTESESQFAQPTVMVLDSFNAGGAQISGGRHATDVEFASDLDYAKGRHSARAGILFEAGHYRSDDVRNAGGTFTFSSLDAYLTGRPTTYAQRTGNPLVSFDHAQFGWYLQDDVRVSKALSLSLGVRQELQTHVNDWLNIAPRVAATWSPFRTGKTVFRGGIGVFYDWYDSQVYEQTLRVNGSRQSEVVVRNPGFPDPYSGGNFTVLPAGRIVQADDLKLPTVIRSNVAIERTLGTSTRLLLGYFFAQGRNLLRGRNSNAPDGSGQRLDPSLGNVTQIESTARSVSHLVHSSLNVTTPWHRTNLFLNYTLARARNDTDGPFSLPADNFNLDAEWGPSPADVRHRASLLFNMDLWKGFKISTMANASSGQPYNITTGFDDNGDTVSNDRPAGLGRNSGRGDVRWDAGGRLSWTFGFGERKTASGPGGAPQIVIRTIGGPASDSMGGFSGGAENKRWRFELYLAGTNLFNRTNPLAYSGVMTSPFFGRFTSALPGRKLEVGSRFYF
ncbi:MAG: TonB-dependent receptor [Vicinamibacterales bacterium]